MLHKSKRENLPLKLQDLALAAKEELKNNQSPTKALPSLLQHPYLKRNLHITLKQNQPRLQNNLIPLAEAKLRSAQIVAKLLSNYQTEKGSCFKTYLSTYFPFQIKKMTRKKAAARNWQNLKYYSQNKEREVTQLQTELEAATKHSLKQKTNRLHNQLQYLRSDYDNYRTKQWQNTSSSNPEYQSVRQKKSKLQRKLLAQLKHDLLKIKQPLERVCKQTWLDIFLNKTSCKPYVTKGHRYKIKPAELMAMTRQRLQEQGYDSKEFDTLSRRGKYNRMQAYIEQIQLSFRKLLRQASIAAWKVQVGPEYWSDRLLAEYG
ncbi:MAG: hypothetical protein KGY75_09240 [Candidatus Cloacimonetes bacterium]|nr:hypothetical protein [Candidatus Cloacimonadota bacterium]MBS3768283.1 hypothetical protein [Candidatus Cloacimonadota bacterium]